MYKVAITETRRKFVTVDAASPQEAHRRVSDAWQNCEVSLSDNDFEGVEFYVAGEADNNDELFNVERKN